MKIEHIGIAVPAPISMGNWYSQHLDFIIIRQLGTDDDGVTFIKDKGSDTVIEFGKMKGIPVVNFNNFDPLQLHIAIECDDPLDMSHKLEKSGAVIIGESPRADAPNERILIKDPWGITLQLINRRNKL